VKIVAIGDVHCRVDTTDLIAKLLSDLQNDFDALLLAGDLTDNGLAEEAEVLVKQLQFSVPVIAILGNHDHEHDQQMMITEILKRGGVHMLDGTAIEIETVGIVGTKGFCGGFDENLVQPFGEAAMKTFIRTSIDEALVMENALTKQLQNCKHKVVLLHYSPVKATLVGEPPELFPFLGTSWLADAIDRRGADVILHGHAHHGSPFGRTKNQIPVHNVSRFVQLEHTGKPYCVIEFA
jgi:Icc-related predicted phosphoesterase